MSLDQEDTTKTSDNSPLTYEANKADNLTNNKQQGDNKAKTNKNREQKMLNLISLIILEIIEENKNEKHKIKQMVKSVFYMKNMPNIELQDYLCRMNKYLKPEISTFIIALIYLDRICSDKKNNILLIENNVYKLFLAAVIIAVKYNEDSYDDNNYFAKVGGITLSEMNILEKEILNLLNFRVWVSEEIYSKYHDYLVSY